MTPKDTNASPGRSADDSPVALVTGGAGFLGSHLCDRLLAEGYRVLCLDNLLTGRHENIRHLARHPRFKFVECDVTKPIDLQAAALDSRGRRVDYVLHLASPASPKDYARHPIHTLKLGALGTYHTLGVAKNQGSVFLLASTSEVYGDPEVSPQPETYWGNVNPIGPRSVYDEAKRFAEAITMAYHREHGVRVRVARIFNTYGERMRIDDGRALPNFMLQALDHRPLTVYGDGRQTRSLCYVSDLIDGLYRLLVSSETGPINIGNPEEITMLDLAREIVELTGSTSPIAFEPLPSDDPKQRCPDISLATSRLGWNPKVHRREGIERVIPYFRTEVARLSGPSAPGSPGGARSPAAVAKP